MRKIRNYLQIKWERMAVSFMAEDIREEYRKASSALKWGMKRQQRKEERRYRMISRKTGGCFGGKSIGFGRGRKK